MASMPIGTLNPSLPLADAGGKPDNAESGLRIRTDDPDFADKVVGALVGKAGAGQLAQVMGAPAATRYGRHGAGRIATTDGALARGSREQVDPAISGGLLTGAIAQQQLQGHWR